MRRPKLTCIARSGLFSMLMVSGCYVSSDASPDGSAAPPMASTAPAAGAGDVNLKPARPVAATGAMVGTPRSPSAEPPGCERCAGAPASDPAKPGDPVAEPHEPARTPALDDACQQPGAFDPLIAKAGETCWSFHAHDLSSPTDTSAFRIQSGESYSQHYYDVPWPAGSIATRFGSQLDNAGMLRHWFLFSSTASMPHGTVSRNVTGTTLGEDAELLAAWTVGGCNVTYPDDVGGALPDSGKIMVQWHHYNDTNVPQPDASEIQICTVPAGSRPHLGGITMLGTEDLGDTSRNDAGEHEREFGSTCINDSAAPITLIGFLPHMHQLGTRMRSIANKSAGRSETIFDQPFTPQRQSNYVLRDRYVLAPGESITSTCTYRNDADDAYLGFGQSWHQEFCYQYAFSYPHGALSNAALSLIGATNTCWSFP